MKIQLSAIRSMLAPPNLIDKELARRARIVHVLYFGLVTVSVLSGLADGHLKTYLILIAANILALFAYWLNRRGAPQAAGFMLLFIYLAAITALLLVGNGIHDIAITGLPVLMIMSALMLERRGVIAFALLAIAATGLVVYAGVIGLPSIVIQTPGFTSFSDFVIIASILSIAAYASHTLIAQLIESLAHTRTSEARLLSLVENTPDFILEINRQGDILYINRFAEQFRGKNIRTTLPATELEQARVAIDTAFATGNSQTLELQTIAPDGHVTWDSIRLGPIKQGDTVTSLTVITTDITAQKSAETTLRESEARISEALVAGGVVPYINDYRSKRFTFIGENVFKLTGYTAREITPLILKNTIQEEYMWGPNVNLTAAEARQRVVAGEPLEWRSDYRILTANGESRWLSDTSVEILDEAGKAIGGIGIFQDITERKQTEEKIRQTSSQLAMLNEIGQAVAELASLEEVLNTILKQVQRVMPAEAFFVTLYNEATNRLSFPFVYDRGQRWQEPDTELTRGTNSSEVLRTGKSILRLITAEELERDRQNPFSLIGDYSEVSASMIYVPLNSKGKIIGTMSAQSYALNAYTEEHLKLLEGVANQAAVAIENARLFTSIQQELAERERAEAQVRHLNEELEQRVRERTLELEAANKELEAFSYSVSHDLRAPLRAINGFARIIKDDFAGALDPMGRNFLEKVIASGNKMNQLIDELLNFSRLNQKPLTKLEVHMRDLVDAVIESLAPETVNRQIEWIISELPTVSADPFLIQQVYANLIGNAVKYSSKRAQARIEIGCRTEGHENKFFVRDNGAGFDMQYAEKLFGIFQRLHGQEEFEGIGIGLATVQRIIFRHGGRIWAEAKPEEGATFFFTLGN